MYIGGLQMLSDDDDDDDDEWMNEWMSLCSPPLIETYRDHMLAYTVQF